MAKTLEKDKAIASRKKGESIKDIAKLLNIAKSTISIWCRDIKLTPSQISKLHKKMVSGSYAGRMKGARIQYEKRLNKIIEADKNGKKIIGSLSKRDLLIASVGLYWGEGSKKNRKLSLNNSDPKMVKFIIASFQKIWLVEKKDFVLRVGINNIHKKRDKEVRKYWSKITEIPLEQFRKTVFIKANNKKKYKNFRIHYGTLTIGVSKSSHIYYQMMGLINGLSAGL